MKIIQQDFKVSSRIWSIKFLLSALFLMYSQPYWEWKFDFFNIAGLLLTIMFIYGSYCTSFIYEFKKKELIINYVFGLLGKKTYYFTDLTKVEYSVSPQGVCDRINLYFEDNNHKKKITITMYQVDLGKIKLFLYTNLDNLEEISVKEYR